MYLSRHLFQHVHQWNRSKEYRFDGDTAIKLGYLKHIEEPYIQLNYTYEGVADAIEHGYLDVLKMLYTHHHEEYVTCDFIEVDTCLMDYAAQNGHLEMVKWMHEIGHACTPWAMIAAAQKRHRDIVIYLHELKRSDCLALDAISTAVTNGYMITAKCLYKLCIENCPVREIPDLREWVLQSYRKE